MVPGSGVNIGTLLAQLQQRWKEGSSSGVESDRIERESCLNAQTA
jgi:hypothetical protein